MNLKFLSISILILFLCFLLMQLLVNKIRILKQIVISIMFFIIQYYLFSVVFLWIDRFEVRHILTVIFIVDVCLCFFWRKKIIEKIKNTNLLFSRDDLVILGILVLLIPFIFVKSQDIRTSSDMGMYFEWTVKLTGDNTGVSRYLNEIGQISENVDEGVYRIQEQLDGVYTRAEHINGTIEYEYHSLPTWVTLMALFAKSFGIYNAAQVLTLLYAITVLCCYFTCENIGKSPKNKYLSITIFALSPIIMYVAKCTLTEIAYINILFFALLCLSESDKKIKYLSGVGFGLLGFIHISNFMYVFAIYLILMYISICRKEKTYGSINLINLAMFGISLFYANFISHFYTESQLSRLNFLGDEPKEIVKWLLLILLICGGLQIFILVISEKFLDKIIKIIQCIMPIGLIFLEIVIIIGFFIQGYYLGFTDKYITGGGTWHLRSEYADQGLKAISYLNIINILRATSFIWVPIIFIFNFIRKRKDDIVQNALLFGLLYSMFIYTYIQIDTPTNYYASRYLAMTIIPLITLLAATFEYTKKVYLCISLWCTIYTLRYDYNFILRGSFLGQYHLIKDTLAQIPYGSVVLVLEEDESLNEILVNNLREMNGNYVYNYSNEAEVKAHYIDQPIYTISSHKIENENQLLLYNNYLIMNNLGGSNGRYMTEEISYTNESIYIYSTW